MLCKFHHKYALNKDIAWWGSLTAGFSKNALAVTKIVNIRHALLTKELGILHARYALDGTYIFDTKAKQVYFSHSEAVPS